MTRVAIYARTASVSGQSTAMTDQIEVCRVFAEDRGWFLMLVFTDEAQSGNTTDRPGLVQLLAGADAGDFDIVVSTSISRFSRDLAQMQAILGRLESRNIDVVTLEEGDVSQTNTLRSAASLLRAAREQFQRLGRTL